MVEILVPWGVHIFRNIWARGGGGGPIISEGSTYFSIVLKYKFRGVQIYGLGGSKFFGTAVRMAL